MSRVASMTPSPDATDSGVGQIERLADAEVSARLVRGLFAGAGVVAIGLILAATLSLLGVGLVDLVRLAVRG